MAPEIFTRPKTGYGLYVDFWSLAITIFHLLIGQVLFDGASKSTVLDKISHSSEHIDWTRIPDDVCRDFLTKMLEADREKRLGCQPGDIGRMKAHDWFAEVDWLRMARYEYASPVLPATDLEKNPKQRLSKRDVFDQESGENLHREMFKEF